MRDGFTYSVLFHVAVAAISYFGLPLMHRAPVMLDAPIMVDVVTVDEMSNAPPPKPKPAKKEAKPEKKKAPPPPKPPRQASPPPPPVSKDPDVAALPPEPKPEAKKKEAPKKTEDVKPKPVPERKLIKAKPRRKPPPPDAFASVLKTVEKLKEQPRPKDKEDEKKKKKEPEKPETFEQQVAKALATRPIRHDPSRPVSQSVIDQLRQQITECWNIQPGAKHAEDLIIEIRIAMNMDGTPRDARIVNTDRMTDPFFRSAAETALRAVLNPRCHPFKLPRENYNQWRDLLLVFDPRYMF